MDCVVVIGVSGCGKSAVPTRLAELFNSKRMEGDDFHPAANVAKLSAGIALQEEDRWPWLQLLADDTAPLDSTCLYISDRLTGIQHE